MVHARAHLARSRVIPAVSFCLILLFGKRLPFKGAEIGIPALGASFVLSSSPRSSGSSASRTAKDAEARGCSPASRAHGDRTRSRRPSSHRPVVAPVIKSVNWFEHRQACVWPIGTHVDGLAVAMLVLVVTLISLLVHIFSLELHARRPPLHPLLRRPEPLHLAACSSLVTSSNTLQLLARLGDHGPLLVHADRALVGGDAELRRRPQGVLHHPHR